VDSNGTLWPFGNDSEIYKTVNPFISIIKNSHNTILGSIVINNFLFILREDGRLFVLNRETKSLLSSHSVHSLILSGNFFQKIN
jgi:hypothetical protein